MNYVRVVTLQENGDSDTFLVSEDRASLLLADLRTSKMGGEGSIQFTAKATASERWSVIVMGLRTLCLVQVTQTDIPIDHESSK